MKCSSDEFLAATAHVGHWFNIQEIPDRGMGDNVIPVYLRITRPSGQSSIDNLAQNIITYATRENKDGSYNPKKSGNAFRDYSEMYGRDGVIVEDDEEFGGTSFVIFDSTQAKSATGNRGSFDPNDPRILYQTEMEASGMKERALDYGRRVKEAAAKWREAVKRFAAGKMAPQELITLGETPDVLTSIKQDALPKLPLVLTQAIAKKATGRDAKKQDAGHKLTDAQLAELPYKLAEPVAVLKEASGNMVVITDMLVGGNPVIVAVEPGTKQNNIIVNDIRTAFGKGGFGGWFKARIENRELRYLDQTKSAALLEHIPGHQLPSVIKAQRSSGQKITWGNEVVKPSGIENGVLYQTALPVESAAFKNWFGDSKIVDENGAPLVVYRGDIENKESFTNAQGNYFVDIERVAQDYSSGGMYSVYLAIKNPFIFEEENFNQLKESLNAKFDDWFGMDDSELANDKEFQKLRTAYIAFRNNPGSMVRDFYNDILPKVSRNIGNEKLRDAMANSLNDFNQFSYREADYRDLDILNPFLKTLGYDGIIRDYDKNGEGVGKEYVTFSPTQIKSVNNRGTFDPNDPRILFQSAFHGSPHRFDKFSLEHIGSGEGVQAYGWGLYFAELKEIAEWYREKLSRKGLEYMRSGNRYIFAAGGSWTRTDGENSQELYYSDPDYRALEALRSARDDVEMAMEQLEDNLEVSDEDEIPVIMEALEIVAKFKRVKFGQLYEVEIPENDVLLDWDKPLSAQSEKVKAALESSDLYSSIKDKIKKYFKFPGETRNAGKAIYNAIADILGSKQAASEYLNTIGISGIRYLDGTSRRAGVGSHNFVIFDDSAIETIKTYYQQRGQSPRGSVTITPDKYTIILGKNANLSTLIHETGHIFEAELRRLAASGVADASQIADLATLDNWLARFDDDAALASEYNARLKKSPHFNGRKFEKLSPEQKELARDIARREYFARGFEAYAREGNAPSVELRGVFDRFKSWLLDIYRHAQSLGVEINDDVRGVFSRMLATEQEVEIAAAADELIALEQAQLDALGLKGPERDFQANLLAAAKQKAVSLAERERNRNRSARLKIWAEEAREQLLADPVYAARAAMRTKDGFLDAEAIEDRYGAEALRALRKSAGPGVARKDGRDPEALAVEHGFASGAEMLAAVSSAESLGAKVKEYVAGKEAEHDAAIDPAAFLVETEEARRAVELTGAWLARNLGKESMQKEAFETAARNNLAQTPMKWATLPDSYMAYMRRALRKERVAIGKGDFEAAFEANIMARMNMEMARQSRELAGMRKAVEDLAKQFTAMKKGDPVARFLVNGIAARFGMMELNKRLAEGKNAETVNAWIKQMEGEGFSLYLSETVLHGQENWREMPASKFAAIADALRNVVTVERNYRRALATQNKADMRSWDRDIRAASQDVTRGNGPLKKVQKHAFDIIAYAQMFAVDLPTWMGAYEKALAEGVKNDTNDAKAVEYADRVVRLTQGSGRTADLSTVQRGGELQKTVTTFYSWFNTMYNLASLTKTEVQQAPNQREAVTRAGAFLFWAWFGTQAMEIALDALRDRTPDDDDSEEWLKYLGGKFAGFWTGMIPLVGKSAETMISGKDFDVFAAARGAESILGVGRQIWNVAEGKDNAGKKAAIGAVRALGYASTTPTEPAAQVLKMVWDYMDGTTPELELRKTLLR